MILYKNVDQQTTEMYPSMLTRNLILDEGRFKKQLFPKGLF